MMQIQKADASHAADLAVLFKDYLTELNPDHPLLQDEAAFEAEFRTAFDPSISERGAKIVIVYGQPAGFALYQLVEDNKALMIYEFYIRPATRRQGVGRALVEDLLLEVSEKGVRHVGLNVSGHNTDALAFWKALGFEVSTYQMVRRGNLSPFRG